MTFNQFQYLRPDLEIFKQEFKQAIIDLGTATSEKDCLKAFDRINQLRNDFNSMNNIAYIRYSINIEDEFYDQERQFFDHAMPHYRHLENDFYRALVDSPYREALEKVWGKQLFVIAELSLPYLQSNILEDMEYENEMRSAYRKLNASAKIDFNEKQYNLSELTPFQTDPNRKVRKAAQEAFWGYYEKQAEAYHQIFDALVKTRHSMAQKQGYKNYIDLAYKYLHRSDYNSESVAKFRDAVLKNIVPISQKIFDLQRQRIGVAELMYYDEPFKFKSGNPKPKGKPEWIIKQADKMYKELSEETAEFFSTMQQKNLMDLVAKKGKAPGGYCTFISNEQAPFIYSNFNGTSGDVDVLTHEAGHAFQVFLSRNYGIKEYNWPTMEACEIHSMSMEFFTYPWMHLFFEEDTDKYKFGHLAASLTFIPYGVAVDEFQHFVYEFPDATYEQRNNAWRTIEKKYLPHRNYEGNEFLEKGNLWLRQSHIFQSPFYYIDYALAQICAFQFWHKSQENQTAAWNDYLRLCKVGGSKSFLELIEIANLNSPFKEEVVQEVVNFVETHLYKSHSFDF